MFNHIRYKFNRYSLAREYLMHLLVILGTFISFYLMDYLSKYFLFNFEKQGTGVSYGIFGIRSLAHNGTTLLSFLKFQTNPQFLGVFALIIAIILSFIMLKLKRKVMVFFIAIIMAGVLGNGVDFLRFGYVQDILYLPWYDTGTFNVADILIVGGAIGLIITILITQFALQPSNEPII